LGLLLGSPGNIAGGIRRELGEISRRLVGRVKIAVEDIVSVVSPSVANTDGATITSVTPRSDAIN
jgi:hypothetical protein